MSKDSPPSVEMSLYTRIRAFCRKRPDLRRQFLPADAHPLAGHSRHASEAYYYATGGHDVFLVERLWHDGTGHWYLRDRASGDVIDLTADRFTELPPYDDGLRDAFDGDEPSEIARIILQNVL